MRLNKCHCQVAAAMLVLAPNTCCCMPVWWPCNRVAAYYVWNDRRNPVWVALQVCKHFQVEYITLCATFVGVVW